MQHNSEITSCYVEIRIDGIDPDDFLWCLKDSVVPDVGHRIYPPKAICDQGFPGVLEVRSIDHRYYDTELPRSVLSRHYVIVNCTIEEGS